MELWDLYDENRKSTGKIHTRGIAMPIGEFHIVVEIFTINLDGKILVTQRDPAKTYPLLWESTGGSITAGETSLQGALRELEEETGLKAAADKLVKIGGLNRKHSFLDTYIWKSSVKLTLDSLTLQEGEVCGAQFVSVEEFMEMNEAGLIVPAVWERYELYRTDIERMINSFPEKH